MSLFRKRTPEDALQEEAEMRGGISSRDFPKLSNEKLIMLALSVLMAAQGVEDGDLIDELNKRAKS